jgi:hypothetical protein
MRIALLILPLLLTACEGSFFSAGDRWRSPRIDEAYAARDACFAKQANAEGNNSDPSAAARAVVDACSTETEKLVEIANRDGDSKVAANIRENSEYRAMHYVMRARGQYMASQSSP